MLRSVCRVHFFVVCILVVCSFDHSHKVTINIGKKKPPNDKMLCINRKIDKPHYVCSSLYFYCCYCCYCCCCLAKGSASASAQACTPPIYLRKMSLFFLLFKLQAIYFRLLIAKAQQFSFFFFC